MARQSNGAYQRPAGTTPNTGDTISPVAYNDAINDIGNEITNSLDRQGRSAMQANLPMGSHKITSLASPDAVTDAGNKDYIDATAASAASAAAAAAVVPYMPKSGGTFTGTITLSGDPSNPLEPATKQSSEAAGAKSGSETSYSNLKLRVTSDTAATLTIDVTGSVDSSFNTKMFRSVSVSMSTVSTGAGGMDTGSVGSSRWLAVWFIGKSDGTSSAVFSSEFTGASVVMPSGYTYKARRGSVRVDASGTLMRTLQRGAYSQYIVSGGTNTANLPIILNTSTGNVTTPTWTAFQVTGNGFAAPTTAASVSVSAVIGSFSGILIIAPNASYGAYSSLTNPPPILLVTGITGTGYANTGEAVTFMLESVNIYCASNTISTALFLMGWCDAF